LEPAVVIKADLDEMSPMERGEYLFHKSVHACGACHSVDGSKKQAPTMLGRFGQPAELSDGSTVTFDVSYLIESINNPKVKLAKGYDPSKDAGAVEMPSFAGKITDQEMSDLTAYLQSL
jgi:cytochrome c oxidase subunit 2